MPEKPATTLRIFRVKDGERVPWVLELDKDLVLMREYRDDPRDETPIEVTARQPKVGKAAQLNPYSAADDGERNKQSVIARWTAAAIKENPIPGTDSLREEYMAERKGLEDYFESKGHPCPSCELGKLARKWRHKLEKAGYI